MIYGDELAPSGGNAGGGIYKFVPAVPSPATAVTVPAPRRSSPGTVYGLRVAASAPRTGARAPKPAMARGSR